MRWATGWTVGVLGLDSRRGLGIFLFTTSSRMDLGPTRTPIQWVSGTLSLGVKRPGRVANHSPPSNAEVKECLEIYLHSPNTSSWRGAQFKGARCTMQRFYRGFSLLSWQKSELQACKRWPLSSCFHVFAMLMTGHRHKHLAAANQLMEEAKT